LVILLVDCIKKTTNFLHSLLYALSFLEVGVWGALCFLFFTGKVKGDRSLSAVSLGVYVLLNFIFIPIHYIQILRQGTIEYQ
jgi:hypothetical protein